MFTIDELIDRMRELVTARYITEKLGADAKTLRDIHNDTVRELQIRVVLLDGVEPIMQDGLEYMLISRQHEERLYDALVEHASSVMTELWTRLAGMMEQGHDRDA